MAISWEERLKWRKTAPFHVQLQLTELTERLKAPSETIVRGTLVRVFRTDGRLRTGDPVAFKLWVCEPGNEPTGPAFIYLSAFVQARYLEAYLYGDPPKLELAAYEFAVLPFPSDAPRLTVEELHRSVTEVQASRGAGTARPGNGCPKSALAAGSWLASSRPSPPQRAAAPAPQSAAEHPSPRIRCAH